MKRSLTLSIILSSLLFGAGYQIPNNSVNSQALATANIAHAHGADTAYYNPARMIYNSNNHEIEGSLSYVKLSQVNYTPSSGAATIKSKKHDAFIPSFHYVSDKLSDSGVRVGFSMIAPAGLSREWENFPAIASAKKFALETIEFNPSIAIPINKKLSLGFGFRYVRAEGQIALDGSMLPHAPALGSINYTLSMEDGRDSSSFGYNMALSYQATDKWNISATYRSKILLDIKGTAQTTFGGTPITSGASMAVPIPANLILATAYTFHTGTTVEVTYDKTMWSAIKETNFNFDNPTLEATLGASTPKKWHDTHAYRMGITQELDALTLMCGIAYSTNAADEQYVSYSSPESDSMTYSIGGRYNISNTMDIGLAILYSQNDKRTVAQATNPLGVNGTFSDKNVYTITVGGSYKF